MEAKKHHLDANKVVSRSVGASSGSIMVSWVHPEKVGMFEILVDFTRLATQGSPGHWDPGIAVWASGALLDAVWRK